MSLYFDCPVCENEFSLEYDALPDCAADDENKECPHCSAVLTLGWEAVGEVRGVVSRPEQLDSFEPPVKGE